MFNIWCIRHITFMWEIFFLNLCNLRHYSFYFKESAKKHRNSLMLFTSSNINPFWMFRNLISKVLSCFIVFSILSNFSPKNTDITVVKGPYTTTSQGMMTKQPSFRQSNTIWNTKNNSQEKYLQSLTWFAGFSTGRWKLMCYIESFNTVTFFTDSKLGR